MKEGFYNTEGSRIVYDLIKVIQKNKQYLSDIDGAIGDGDHGINMNKGFTLCGQKLEKNPGNLAHCLTVLSDVLVQDIGGSMGPLYGMLFLDMSEACKNEELIDVKVFGKMLTAAEASIREIGTAEVGDKTMLDTLVPAVKAFNDNLKNNRTFCECLDAMKAAAQEGRDSTEDMVAKVGRASRLGERSRGVIDAGAASSCLIFETMADSIKAMIE